MLMTDGSGNVLESGSYLPYGGQRGSSSITGSGYTFTDQELDGESGLFNYDARLYDPVVGLFLSADTVVPGGGFDPQMLNRFAYVRNNPLIYIDPSGHVFTDEDGNTYDSDPSDYDIDYGGTDPEKHVDAIDGDDPGEAEWEYSEKYGWTVVAKAPGSRVGRLIDANGKTIDHVFLSEDEVIPRTDYNNQLKSVGASVLSALGISNLNRPNNVYNSAKESPEYPEDFKPKQNGTTINTVKNKDLLSKLREIERGRWQKVYKDGWDASGGKISVHYFRSASGKAFDVWTKSGWSN